MGVFETYFQTIGIENQWVFRLAIKYKGDTIPVEELGKLELTDLKDFTIISETGNLLPTFRIIFESNHSWKPFWNENSILSFILAQNSSANDVPVASQGVILSKNVRDIGGGKFLYYASGVYNAPAFTQTPHIRTLGPSSGIEAIRSIVSPYFGEFTLEGNVITAVSKESMPWYQMNTSDKKFVDHIISHSYIPNSFPVCGIGICGNYVLYDAVEQCHQPPKWVIGEHIQPVSPPQYISRSGFMNHIGLYGMDLPIISGEYGVRTVHRIDIDLGLVDAKPPNNGSIERKTLPPVYYNSCNVSEHYYIAKAMYDIGNALMSMELVNIIAVDTETFIDVLDVVYFIDDFSNSTFLDQDTSGKYIVNKMARGIRNNLPVLKVQLGRDSHNMQ